MSGIKIVAKTKEEEDKASRQTSVLNWDFLKIPLKENSNNLDLGGDEIEVKHHLSEDRGIFENSFNNEESGKEGNGNINIL